MAWAVSGGQRLGHFAAQGGRWPAVVGGGQTTWDLLLMGLLLLEQQRLRDMQRDGDEVGEAWVQARTTDRLRMLEVLCQQWNVDYLEERLRTPGGTRRVLRELRRRAPCQVA